MPASIDRPNAARVVRSGPYTVLICDTFVRFRRLKTSTTRSSLPCGLMSKYLITRRSTVADDGRRTEFLDNPSGREVNGNARDRLSSPPVITLIGPPDLIVRIG